MNSEDKLNGFDRLVCRLHSTKFSRLFSALLVFALTLGFASSAAAESEEVDDGESGSSLSREVEDLKKSAVELNRDLLILEEELLFPSNTQIAVFLSVDVGHYFRLDSVKVSVDDELVTSHLYTDRQNSALSKGGIQRLYVGNVKSGKHEITAIFTGLGPDDRDYKRGATMVFDKDEDPKMIEIRVRDAQSNMQPTFDFKEWEL